MEFAGTGTSSGCSTPPGCAPRATRTGASSASARPGHHGIEHHRTRSGLVRARCVDEAHGGFGRPPGETDRPKGRHRVPSRPHRAPAFSNRSGVHLQSRQLRRVPPTTPPRSRLGDVVLDGELVVWRAGRFHSSRRPRRRRHVRAEHRLGVGAGRNRPSTTRCALHSRASRPRGPHRGPPGPPPRPDHCRRCLSQGSRSSCPASLIRHIRCYDGRGRPQIRPVGHPSSWARRCRPQRSSKA
jgi:hypothetical protein